ncbi:alpha/beta hydrolase [Arvimicrobium flavum]|uniref:alpha/beta hydrolase n=1 Tax=Arvimicrobium flavum TaxID=3393320 RepID=UPI00237B1771|nr:alpha/beta fold hydrolase [Mesorhizobium shangrilense]
MQRTLLYPGAGGFTPPPAVAPWGSRVSIATSDGETLAALYQSPANAKATFLYLHGNGDDIAAYGFLADALGARGYGMLAVAFRGYPGSTGSPTEAGLLEDGVAAFDWLKTTHPGTPVAILGRSLGSGVGVHVAAERDVFAMVLVSPYASILAAAGSHYPYLPVAPLIKDSFRSDLWIGQVSAPKLFLHGELDDVIPASSGRALFDLASEPKKFVLMSGRGHNDVWSAQLVDEVVGFADAVKGRER